MPKGRMLNRKISLDKEVAKLSQPAIILYSWTIPHLDCEGKIHASPAILKGVVCPYLKFMTPQLIGRCLKELSQTPLVVIYGDDCKYMKFLGFAKNQNIREGRESPSDIPDPTPAELHQSSSGTPAKDKISKDKISKGANALLSDDEFLETLKTNPAYKHINIDNELAKMDAWLLVHRGRQKTKRFIVKWLNRIETPMEIKPKIIKEEKRPDPINPEEHAKVAKLIHETAEKLKAK